MDYHQVKGLVSLGILVAGLGLQNCQSGANAEEPRFHRIKTAEIRATFSNREFSDEIHWAERYRPDGVLEGSGMGRRFAKRWAAKDDLLCITDDEGEDCREVWKAGNRIDIRRWSDNDLPKAGIMRAIKR